MFTVNDDLSIYATRGDVVFFSVAAEDSGKAYKFQAGDVVRIKVYGKKDAESVVLQKDFPVTEEAEKVDIYLTEEDTKIGEVISKPKDYWYEVELNPFDNPQTIIGYDEDGAKVFKLFPEGDDVPDIIPNPRAISVMDDELDMASTRPVQNQAIARAFTLLSADFEKHKEDVNKQTNDALNSAAMQNEAIAIERARVDALVAGGTAAGDSELRDVRIGADGVTYASAGTSVRRQMDDVNKRIGQYMKRIVNLLNPEAVTKNKVVPFLDASGAITDSEYYSISEYIEVKPGQTYSLRAFTNLGSTKHRVALYGANKEYIGSLDGTLNSNETVTTFRTPSADGVYYLIANLPLNGYEEYMLVEGSEYPDKYYAYGTHLFMDNGVVCYADDIKKSIGWEKANFVNVGKNLFNLEDVTWGEYFIYNGTFAEHEALGHSGLIAAKPDTLYSVTSSPNYPSYNSIAAMYNANGALITTAKAEKSDDGKYWTFTTDSKCAYIMLNLAKANYEKIMLVESDGIGEYEPFKLCLSPLFALNEKQKQEAWDNPTASPLYGKSVTFNGDSICSGVGYAGGYGKIIAEAYNMTYENIAVGGAPIIHGLPSSTGNGTRHSVSATISQMNKDADYAIVEGGVNDANEQRPLGTLSDGYDEELDTSTFYGAFEYMCKELVTRFAGKKIGYIAVHKWVQGFDSRYKDKSYYYAAKECCEKWGVPFCDLNTLLPPLSLIDSLKTSYLADSIHPNEAGYRKYYVPKIIAFMESL